MFVPRRPEAFEETTVNECRHYAEHPDSVTADSTLAQLKIDQLDVVMFMSDLEKIFGVEFTDDEIFEIAAGTLRKIAATFLAKAIAA